MQKQCEKPPKISRGRPQVYPWSEWLVPGRSKKLGKGDYRGTASSFRCVVYVRAKIMGVKVSVAVLPKGIVWIVCHKQERVPKIKKLIK